MENLKLFSHELATKAERLGHLPEEWLTEIYKNKLFKLFVPKELGGLGCTLPEALKIEEKLAKLDGSLGWTVTLCAGAAWFVGFMDESLRNDIFPDEKLCLAGSGFVGGKADKIDDTYIISGSWTYASGALHATHLTANCEILEHGEPLLDKKGKPEIKAFVIDRKDVEILDGWNYMGMIATGSHAFRCEDLSVPLNRCFEILPEKAQLTASVYQYPFLQFAEATLAANILGISIHLIEVIEQSFWKRNEYRKYDKKHLSYFQNLLNKQSKKLEKLRDEFYRQVNDSWAELEENGKISKSRLKKVSLTSRKLTQKCREINSKLYPFSGLEAAKTHTELNRIWRDFNTVGQHALLIFPF
ncbi:alkylation response protein AidB-like acyl-CoA dehydrogenase [Algoriphagus ratkowskyi]|uniref:Acyl-CoA dehydrogenase n=1 Tax=Algoriphagus ratkowskyi TaxID=57028 RepID=A0A2W7RRA7_9BACT|nr:acyl-CoA dehydrogenase family protein [Algoriphagus ratkowskyi]PZX57059.1 alkylation response protein AidB-like acyl-CoA dehydrogenase [Algoriphagus ratkowskyi]TXD79956.1 acyl-CoA dehydrogenase [Algoriphagus ratkowskyi]